jgi:hypothetical protein
VVVGIARPLLKQRYSRSLNRRRRFCFGLTLIGRVQIVTGTTGKKFLIDVACRLIQAAIRYFSGA